MEKKPIKALFYLTILWKISIKLPLVKFTNHLFNEQKLMGYYQKQITINKKVPFKSLSFCRDILSKTSIEVHMIKVKNFFKTI